MCAGLVTSVALIPIALLPTVIGTGLSMFVFGVGWIIGASSLQTTVQLACAPWVRARGLAIYQAVYNGGMGLGAVAWGWLGTHAGLTGTILAAGLGGIVIAVLARSQQLPGTIADPAQPAARDRPHITVDDSIASLLASARHPVLVTITYRVDPPDIAAFRTAMEALRLARRRDGAIEWMLARDVEHPEQWVEAFRLPDWHELRRGVLRVNLLDDEASQAARALHRGGALPRIRVLVTDGA
jgi:MFS family permease